MLKKIWRNIVAIIINFNTKVVIIKRMGFFMDFKIQINLKIIRFLNQFKIQIIKLIYKTKLLKIKV